jgi:hypothetical protein
MSEYGYSKKKTPREVKTPPDILLKIEGNSLALVRKPLNLCQAHTQHYHYPCEI